MCLPFPDLPAEASAAQILPPFCLVKIQQLLCQYISGLDLRPASIRLPITSAAVTYVRSPQLVPQIAENKRTGAP